MDRNEILRSIKSNNSVTNLQKMMVNNPNQDLVIIIVIQNLVKFSPFALKILSRNDILTSIKGRNSFTNLKKMALYNPNLDLVNVNHPGQPVTLNSEVRGTRR